MNVRIEEAASRLSDKAASRLAETSDQLAAEASEFADRVTQWLADNGPVVAEAVRARTEDTVDMARGWAETLPERLAKALPVVTVHAKPKKRTIVGAFVVGAGVAYFFDPQMGSTRRNRVKEKVMGLFGGGSTKSEE